MLRSYSFMSEEIDISLYYEIWNEIGKLRWYFYKFAGNEADEAMQRTLMHTLTHFQPEKGNLNSYLKKLAREILKDGGKLVTVDFLEQTVVSDEDEVTGAKSGINTGKVDDFSDEIVDTLDLVQDKSGDVERLALEFMDRFVILCEAMQTYDMSSRYYPDVFISQCLSLLKKCENFNEVCLNIYSEYGEKFKWYLEVYKNVMQIWKEADFPFVLRRTSKNISLISKKTGVEVQDADLEPFTINTVLDASKRVLRVRYYDLWEQVCDLLDEDGINELRFTIGDNFIVRTLAGSQSVLNPDLYNEYDIVRTEILTNVLYDTNGKLLNAGSECFYLLYNAENQIRKPIREIYGIKIDFQYEDITSELTVRGSLR